MSSKTNFPDIRQQWDVLKLTILKRAYLTDETLQTFVDLRKDPYKATIDAWRSLTPLTVARVSEPLTKFIIETSVANRTVNRFLNPFHVVVRYFYYRDIKRIHRVLFGPQSRIKSHESRSGRFGELVSTALHPDRNRNGQFDPFNRQTTPTYFARLGALPLEYVTSKMLATLTKEQTALVERAQEINFGTAQGALTKLRQQKILEILPLGDVAIIAAGYKGTLHCSSPVPPGGAYSALIRAFTTATFGD